MQGVDLLIVAQLAACSETPTLSHQPLAPTQSQPTMSTIRKPFPPLSDAAPVNVTGFKTYTAARDLPSDVTELKQADVHSLVQFLIKAIVEIKDETGDFLLHLDDGRVIDTKGWAGFEWVRRAAALRRLG